MFEGKVRLALRLLSRAGGLSGQSLSLSDMVCDKDTSLGTVYNTVMRKHPSPRPVSPQYVLLSSTPPDHDPHSVLFDQPDGSLVRRVVISMDGAAGPSGLDSSAWKRLCSSFSSLSIKLCMYWLHWPGVLLMLTQ